MAMNRPGAGAGLAHAALGQQDPAGGQAPLHGAAGLHVKELVLLYGNRGVNRDEHSSSRNAATRKRGSSWLGRLPTHRESTWLWLRRSTKADPPGKPPCPFPTC